MPKQPDNQAWRYWRTVLGVVAAAAVVVIGGLTGHVRRASADNVDCSQVKCVALTFDDGPHPKYTEQVLALLRKYGLRACFFELGSGLGTVNGDKVTLSPLADVAKKVLDALKPGGDFVVANANLGETVEHCGGVTAYLPAPTDEISPYYKDLRFAQRHGWDEFLRSYRRAVRGA